MRSFVNQAFGSTFRRADIIRIFFSEKLDMDTPDEKVHVNLDDDFPKSLQEIKALRPWREPLEIELSEKSGDIKYVFVTNDGTDESLIELVHCKCLFGRQLPKMPKEYIVRLVFDRRHFTLVMKKTENKVTSVVAAVCFRPFGKFAEIAFLAVSSKDQVRGYGTRLMNYLKEGLKVHGITDLVTYADNAAVGYFAKQGFYSPPPTQGEKLDSESHTCVKAGYEGFIKDYDGANKMVCCIYKDVDYLSLPVMRAEVSGAIWLEYLKNNSLERRTGLPTMPLRVFEIPGLEFLAPTKESPEKRNQRRPLVSDDPRGRPVPSRLQVATSVEAMVTDVIETALSNGSSWPFKEPVDIELAPDYYQVVLYPMDLSTMRKKNSDKQYTSLSQLANDFKLMFDNCLFYNGDDSVYANAAQILGKAVSLRIQRLEQMAQY